MIAALFSHSPPGLTTAYVPGFLLGLSLIVAIGAQNAFVLRQGLRREHVFLISLTCALSDALLITLGVAGFAVVSKMLPWVEPLLRYGGAAFLFLYGLRSFAVALRSDAALMPSQETAGPVGKALATCLALTWLNPHVYLDTVVFLGSISTGYGESQAIFGFGAVTASFVFFFSLGYGARLLRPLFARPSAWRVLEAGVGVVMWTIAASLLWA
ncbi:LysE/ArgO family amino acid transporter [Denitrobaculum tricleocarpae]|uniref:Amino acid transporter n=1 Tax=Denitrobaculum tricleocarpae TaxID=2591009 RepID=A0A545TLB0_9PROT|nr:LysE/ArgO family amino acid transporter [Denitrobaculum tricleocarpae]TQV77951.1 amino acid transporter [Denitrobaculum tricleocarpae]